MLACSATRAGQYGEQALREQVLERPHAASALDGMAGWRAVASVIICDVSNQEVSPMKFLGTPVRRDHLGGKVAGSGGSRQIRCMRTKRPRQAADRG